jgi:REP element-mobilizing transposase RayT
VGRNTPVRQRSAPLPNHHTRRVQRSLRGLPEAEIVKASYQGIASAMPQARKLQSAFRRWARMSIPSRNATPSRVVASERTFFVTSSTWGKRALLQSDRSARLLINVLYHYRKEGKYLLHEFVIMPDHFHVVITVGAEMTVEKAVQFIKGGFAFRAGRELGFHAPVWQKGVFGSSGDFARSFTRNSCVHPIESGEAVPRSGTSRLSVFIGASWI